MEFLSQFLPIIIYMLLIIAIIIGIVLGIKLIVTIDKTIILLDDVNKKIDKVSPLFNAVGIVSGRMNSIVSVISDTIEKVITKFFVKDKDEMESEEDE